MKRILLIVLALAPASLSGQHLEYLGGGGGLVSPAGSFGDVDNAGWHLSALGIGRVRRSVRFTIDAVYGQTAHEGGVAGRSTLAGGTLSLPLFLASETRRVRPFIAAGIGAFRVNVNVPGFGSAAATKFAWDIGGGALIGSGRRRVFLVARYVKVSTSPKRTSFLPISVALVWPVGAH